MIKNAITNSEVLAYRLCHHSFDGLSVTLAAEIMRVTSRRVEQLLVNLEVKAPQLFPILTVIQARIYHLYIEEGWTMRAIANYIGRDEKRVRGSLLEAIAKGMPELKPKRGKPLRYDGSMDAKVQEVF